MSLIKNCLVFILFNNHKTLKYDYRCKTALFIICFFN